jgi:pyruvate dehydrogenase E2 component (dihydrolipoamide acetyltransferase)
MTDFTMPALGADMETGKVVQWLVPPGARVRPGDVVAVVETHKGAIDVEIFLDGVIDDLAPLDVELPVGALLARVRAEGEPVPPAPRAAATAPTAAAPVAPMPGASAPAPPRQAATPLAATLPEAPASRARVTPAARQRARELGVDSNLLPGTGVEGAVTLADVERAAAARDAPPTASTQPARGFDPVQMRIAIAAAVARSKREIPHYYLSEPVPMRAALDWLRARNEAQPVTARLLPAVLLIKATALALRAAPELNGLYVDGAFRPSAAAHVGVAIALRGGGLVAPALHDVQDKPLAQLMAELSDLVQRARAGRIRSSEMTDPTITVTNLGDQGVESVAGVIYPPQVALVGFGRVAERPWVEDGRVVGAPVVVASLAADHRVSDGHRGGVFLARLRELLHKPREL